MSGPNDPDALAEARLDGELDDAAWAAALTQHGDSLATALTRAAALRGVLAGLDRPTLPDDVRSATIDATAATRAPSVSTPIPTGPATSAATTTDADADADAGARPHRPALRFPWRAIVPAALAAGLVVALIATLAVGSHDAAARGAIAQQAATPAASARTTPADRPAFDVFAGKQTPAMQKSTAADGQVAVAALRKKDARAQADADVSEKSGATADSRTEPVATRRERPLDEASERIASAQAEEGGAANAAAPTLRGDNAARRADAASPSASVVAAAEQPPERNRGSAIAAGGSGKGSGSGAGLDDRAAVASSDGVAPVAADKVASSDGTAPVAADKVDETLLAEARQYVAQARPDVAAKAMKTAPPPAAAPAQARAESPTSGSPAPTSSAALSAAVEVPGPLALTLAIDATPAIADRAKEADGAGRPSTARSYSVRIANRTVGAMPLPNAPPMLHGYDAAGDERWRVALHPIAASVAAGGEVSWRESASGALTPPTGVATVRLEWGELRSPAVEWRP